MTSYKVGARLGTFCAWLSLVAACGGSTPEQPLPGSHSTWEEGRSIIETDQVPADKDEQLDYHLSLLWFLTDAGGKVGAGEQRLLKWRCEGLVQLELAPDSWPSGCRQVASRAWAELLPLLNLQARAHEISADHLATFIAQLKERQFIYKLRATNIFGQSNPLLPSFHPDELKLAALLVHLFEQQGNNVEQGKNEG